MARQAAKAAHRYPGIPRAWVPFVRPGPYLYRGANGLTADVILPVPPPSPSPVSRETVRRRRRTRGPRE